MAPLPLGQVCIYRFLRTFDGVTQGVDAVRYECSSIGTERMSTTVTFRITARMECDDVANLVPVTGLKAQGTTIRRTDGFAHFSGRAQVINATPEPDVVLFSGTLELIARIGSHPGLGEPCAPDNHVEGWFDGEGVGAFSKMSLRVIFAGAGQLAVGTHAFPNAAQNRVAGTLVVAP